MSEVRRASRWVARNARVVPMGRMYARPVRATVYGADLRARVPDDLKHAVATHCALTGLSESEVVRSAVYEYLEAA